MERFITPGLYASRDKKCNSGVLWQDIGHTAHCTLSGTMSERMTTKTQVIRI